tara:strand:- start:121 stop:309 length:189 start_codon:yes stop_codon:yes gene_type:complete
MDKNQVYVNGVLWIETDLDNLEDVLELLIELGLYSTEYQSSDWIEIYSFDGERIDHGEVNNG